MPPVYQPARAKVRNTARRLALRPREERVASAVEKVTSHNRLTPCDSSELPWDAIFALRGCPNPDGLS